MKYTVRAFTLSQPGWPRLAMWLCASTILLPAADVATTLRPAKLQEMDQVINEAIAEKRCPGGVLWFEHKGINYHKAYGNRSVEPDREPMTEDTIFDAASLTKVLACTPAIMLLIEREQVKLDEPAKTYIPEFTGGGKEQITIRQLLTHTSGLRPDIETRTDWHGQVAAIEKACEEELQDSPGSTFRYSDINFLLLGEIVQRVSKTPLQEFVEREIYRPLKMTDTGYLPPEGKLVRIAPTEVVNGKAWRGVVHDPTARHMGGVAGHAGLFITGSDVARYARMLLGLGELGGVRVFKPETVKLMTSVQTPSGLGERRGLGWDIDSGYSRLRGDFFPLGSYGHTGWTGTSLWVDPFSQSFVIFLSNRNHPTEAGNVSALRARLGTLAAEAIGDFNFVWVPGALQPRQETENGGGLSPTINRKTLKLAKVLNGIDVLVKNHFAPLKGKRVGLISNHTGQSRERQSTIDLLKNARGVELAALFNPEHGIRGTQDEAVGDGTDEKTGLPIYSLYGKTAKPTPEQIKDLDALVFDIQDVGCRFYTYTSTMGLCLEAAGEAHIKFYVLDRVDPINGVTLDGPVLTEETSFVGFHAVPLRYGMTIGEEARMFNEERHCNAELTVIPIEGWSRDMWFDQTGLPWTSPSPNMRTLTAALLYPGIGLLETALSVGRGTERPFELIGAPYIEDVRLAEELNNAGLGGVRFVPIQFTPTASIHKGELCRGVSILVNDRDSCEVVDTGLLIAKTLHRWYPKQFDVNKIGHLLLHAKTLEAIQADKSLTEIKASWKHELDEYVKRREKYLIYN